MSTNEKDKIVRLNGFWGAQRSDGWEIPRVLLFCIKRGKLERTRGFFPRKTCEPLFVRGTTSFYNKKLQILPVGEGYVWNVRM